MIRPLRRILLLLAFAGYPAFARETVRAVFVDAAPRLDGRLDDEAWKKASTVDHFFQREPNPGKPVSEKTEVLVCYDHDRIYFGFRCYEEDSRNITAKEMARDVSLGEDDRVQVILDTFLDGRNGYWFQIGPRGSIGDALIGDNGAVFDKNWDGLWDGRARIHKNGWDAEIAIPFKTMNFRPGNDRWGLKLIRHIRRKLESSYWPEANLNTYRFQVSDAAILEGLEGIGQGIGLDVSPYALGGFDHKIGEDNNLKGDVGLDLYYQVTPGLKSALSINTDFAQTEVDARQINLTRFQPFFPEKRDFFLQGSNYFSFGPSGQRIIPFFSRRIGLDLDGNPIPMLGGAKLTGQVGQWNLGVLDAVDDRSTGNHNFGVARIRRNLGSQSALGFILTDGNSFSDARNTMFGADFKLASSKFRRNKNISFTVFGLGSRTGGTRGRDGAFGAELLYPNDFLNAQLGFHQIGDNFQAGAGYVPRLGIRETYFQFILGPRPKRWHILQAFVGLDGDFVTNLDNRLETRRLNITPLNLMFRSGDSVALRVSPQYEYLSKDFAIYPGHVVHPGGYDFTRRSLEFISAPRRNLWVSSSYKWGAFWNGARHDALFGFGYKVRVPLFLGMEFERNHVKLSDGEFTTNISRISANILFRPNITLYNYIQYDNLSRVMGWQSRFRWILTPGNEIYFVWNSRWLEPLERRELTEGSARLKIRYNFRF